MRDNFLTHEIQETMMRSQTWLHMSYTINQMVHDLCQLRIRFIQRFMSGSLRIWRYPRDMWRKFANTNKTEVNVFNVINDTHVLAINIFNVMLTFWRCTHRVTYPRHVMYSLYKSACIVKTDVNVFNVINDTCVLAFNVFNVMVVFLRCTHSRITTAYTVN